MWAACQQAHGPNDVLEPGKDSVCACVCEYEGEFVLWWERWGFMGLFEQGVMNGEVEEERDTSKALPSTRELRAT